VGWCPEMRDPMYRGVTFPTRSRQAVSETKRDIFSNIGSQHCGALLLCFDSCVFFPQQQGRITREEPFTCAMKSG